MCSGCSFRSDRCLGSKRATLLPLLQLCLPFTAFYEAKMKVSSCSTEDFGQLPKQVLNLYRKGCMLQSEAPSGINEVALKISGHQPSGLQLRWTATAPFKGAFNVQGCSGNALQGC